MLEARRPFMGNMLTKALFMAMAGTALVLLPACSDDDEEVEQSVGTGGFKSILFKGATDQGVLSDGTKNDQKNGVAVGSGRYVWAGAAPAVLFLTMPDDYMPGSPIRWDEKIYDASGSPTSADPSMNGSVATLTVADADAGKRFMLTAYYVNSDDMPREVSVLVPVTKAPGIILSAEANAKGHIQANINSGGATNIGGNIATLTACSNGFVDYYDDKTAAPSSLYLKPISGVDDKTGVIKKTADFTTTSSKVTLTVLRAGTASYEVYEGYENDEDPKDIVRHIGNITISISHAATVKITGAKVKQGEEAE